MSTGYRLTLLQQRQTRHFLPLPFTCSMLFTFHSGLLHSLIIVNNDSLAPSLPTEFLFIHQLRFQCLLFLNNQTKSISSIPSPGISNHLIITTADVREKCYLNKEVHSNIISKNKTWKPPKYSIIEEQL